MKIPNYDFKKVEQEMREFWDKNHIYPKAKKRNEKGKVFYFLDGPPYTSGRVHLGTAWNKMMKDTLLRYKRMQGLNVWDRAGYDMHGLPTEHAVEKKLGLKGKEDILKMGMESFVKECEKLSVENMRLMNEDFRKLGVWMDFDNAYQSINPSFIEGVWWVVKKAHEQGRLYEGLRTMHWCASCATSVAKHELEYKTVTDDSIFVKLQLRGKKDEFLIVWTTTPWTIPFNLAVMVNPELEYVKCRVDKEFWYVSKALAGAFIMGVAGKKLDIVEEFMGDKLEGVEYIHPFEDEIPEYKKIRSQSPKAHTVLLSTEYVDTTAGTGLVHCAPGCGPEDYEVGVRNKIPPYNNIDEKGAFPDNMGEFAGLVARSQDKIFIEALKKRGAIIDIVPVEHEYAHCWRCHNPVVFRTTTQWFFKIEDIKDKLIAANKNINWIGGAGASAMDSWLRNLRDNSITKQRYWGTPLPVWKCQHCHDYVVIGSQSELESLSKMKLKDLHKPWIDEVTIPCKCGAQKTRIPDVMDVWLDAGTNAWTCLDFPKRKDLVDSMYPAEFILEAKDQIRGWFYVLLLEGEIGFAKAPFKNVFMHGWIIDSLGRKMSKSLGNYILPEEITAQYGADAYRFYMIGAAMPGVDGVYNPEEVKAKFRNLGVLWNLHKYLVELVAANNYSTEQLEGADLNPKSLGAEERYILSKLHSSIKLLTEHFEAYRLNETPHVTEDLFLELSRTYIQLVRDKLSTGDDEEKLKSSAVIYTCMKHLLTLFAPTAPFIAECMYQNLKEQFGWKGESVHHFEWPKCDKRYIDPDLEQSMSVCGQIMASILAAREKAQLSVRWPIKSVTVVTHNDEVTGSLNNLGDLVKTQTNVKELKVQASLQGVTMSCRLDAGKLGADFGAMTPKILIAFGREKQQSVIAGIQKDKRYQFKVESQEVTLTDKHVVIDRSVPAQYIEVETKGGLIYLDKTRTPELESEGYVRELMRRIQAFRKTQGLEKKDRVALHIRVSPALLKDVTRFEDAIQEKVGAKDITIAGSDPTKQYVWSGVENIKEESFGLWMSKL